LTVACQSNVMSSKQWFPRDRVLDSFHGILCHPRKHCLTPSERSKNQHKLLAKYLSFIDFMSNERARSVDSDRSSQELPIFGAFTHTFP
jgi:hypothetical protein